MYEIIKNMATKNKETSINQGMKETTLKSLNESPIQNNLNVIENSSLESIKTQNELALSESYHKENIEQKCLSDIEKKQINTETGWSNEVINAINSIREYEIYKKAELVEADINGRNVLIRSDIDWEQKDSMGRTNMERSEAGLSPINREGDTIELHHIGQKNDGPFELTPDEHRSKSNYSILHDSTKQSEINRDKFNNERVEHWKERSNKGGQNA